MVNCLESWIVGVSQFKSDWFQLKDKLFILMSGMLKRMVIGQVSDKTQWLSDRVGVC